MVKIPTSGSDLSGTVQAISARVGVDDPAARISFRGPPSAFTLGLPAPLHLLPAMQRALLLVLVAIGFAQSAFAAQIWTPPGQGTGRLNRPKDVKDVQPVPTSTLERITAMIAKLDAAAADEIEEANRNGSAEFVFYDTRPGGRSNRGMTNPAQNTIGLRRKGATRSSMASTLLHEWIHMQNLKGKDGTPTSAEEEENPCQHKQVYEQQLELLCELARCAADLLNTNPDITWDQKDCDAFESVCESWKQLALECALLPYQVPEFPTAIPVGFMWPQKPCEPEGC